MKHDGCDQIISVEQASAFGRATSLVEIACLHGWRWFERETGVAGASATPPQRGCTYCGEPMTLSSKHVRVHEHCTARYRQMLARNLDEGLKEILVRGGRKRLAEEATS